MSLIDLVNENIIKTPMAATDKPEALRELVQVLVDAGQTESFAAVLEAVLEREDKMSTGLQDGIAVPHGKTHAVSGLKLVIGIAPQGIEFDALDGEPARLFFLLVAPPDQSGPHVQALAEIAKLAQSKAFCKALMAAKDAAEVVALIKE